MTQLFVFKVLIDTKSLISAALPVTAVLHLWTGQRHINLRYLLVFCVVFMFHSKWDSIVQVFLFSLEGAYKCLTRDESWWLQLFFSFTQIRLNHYWGYMWSCMFHHFTVEFRAVLDFSSWIRNLGMKCLICDFQFALISELVQRSSIFVSTSWSFQGWSLRFRYHIWNALSNTLQISVLLPWVVVRLINVHDLLQPRWNDFIHYFCHLGVRFISH